MTATSTPATIGPCPSRERPVDLIHLARQTGGSRQIESEVLRLMARQIAQALDRSELERDAIAPLAHAIGGAARNLGAFPLARVAQSLEGRPGDAASMLRFREELRRTLGFIERLEGKFGRVDAPPCAH